MEPKIVHIENEALSGLLPWGSLVLCSCTLAAILLSNMLERWLLPKLYPALQMSLSVGENEKRRRSFTYVHVGVGVMLALVVSGAYPVSNFLVCPARVSSMLFKDITYGDHLFVLSQIYSTYYLFELCFRTRFASPISIAHHIGLLIVIQTALALFGDRSNHPEAILEFYMYMVWGESSTNYL
jgi:hypothetical protein